MSLLGGLIKAVSGGGGGGSSSSTTTADQTGASEQGVNATSSGTVAQSGVSLGGSNNKNNLGGEYNAPGGNISVGYDAAQFQSSLAAVGGNLNSALKAQAANQNETLDKVLTQLSSLAESKQTDGVSGLSKTALYAIAIVTVGLVVWLFYRK
jgi:hypothetical protein